MAKRELPSPELLRQLLAYDPETGSFIWKSRPLEMFEASPLRSPEIKRLLWNGKHEGEPALTSRNRDGYLGGKVFGRTHSAHRIAWAVHFGEWPDGEIDHINHVRDDNRIANLRVVSRRENCRNREVPGQTASGVAGVYFVRKQNAWRVHINKRYIGFFKSKEAAIAARAKAEIEHGYHPNHGKRSLQPAVAAKSSSS